MPYREADHVFDLGRAPQRDEDETSDESFDRVAFARAALDLVRPSRTTVAICEGASRMSVQSGRVWGRDGERWAMLAIPPAASRRAIALAVAELSHMPRPYALHVLLAAELRGIGPSA
jgi:hypothetical protein